MKFSTLAAFALPVGLTLAAAIPKELTERQSSQFPPAPTDDGQFSSAPTNSQSSSASTDPQGSYIAIAHDLVRFKVDIALLEASTAAYTGYLNIEAAQRINGNIQDVVATLDQSIADASEYAVTFHTAAQQELDSQQIVAAVNSVAPAVHSAVNVLIAHRDDLEPGPFDVLFAQILILSSLRQFLNKAGTLENDLLSAVSPDQVANLQVAFVPIISDLNRANNYYSGP
jgi:hypothetical protein